MTIWKFPLRAEDVQEINMPIGAKLLCVQVQAGQPHIWAMVDPDKQCLPRLLFTAGTGHKLNNGITLEVYPYVGTYQLLNGSLVFHVFDGGWKP